MKTKAPTETNKKLSPKQLQAFNNWVGNGWNKAKALRDAGYSEAVVNNPSKVFESPAIASLIADLSVNLGEVLVNLYKRTRAVRIKKMSFPPYRERRKNETKEDYSLKVISDEDIRSMFAENENKVLQITHSQRSRLAYYTEDDNETQLRAMDMIIRLHGFYPPVRVAVEEKPLEQFSLVGLRRKRLELEKMQKLELSTVG